jgi:hypothetical protein
MQAMASFPDTFMARARESVRTGSWLTAERIRLVAGAILAVSVISLAYLAVTANNLVDSQGRPLGTDFSSFYAAGSYVRQGEPAAPYDPAQQLAREQALFGPATPYYSWFYPPTFLFAAGALALMPYGVALAVWLATTLGLYLLAIRAIIFPPPRLRAEGEAASPPGSEVQPSLLTRIAAQFDLSPYTGRGTWLLLALAFPAVLVNAGHGQNGFLTAALFGGALALLDRRPLIAGMLFGMLTYKPQLAMMIPFALVASGRWRILGAAGVTVIALGVACTIAFGADIWRAFFNATHIARAVVLEQGDVGFYKMQSVFAWARMWGAPVSLAYALQGVLAAGLAAIVIVLWRSAMPYAQKAAALCVASVLATPFAFDYDMMVLAPAIAVLAVDGIENGFAPWEKTALAALWLVPIVARTFAMTTMIPLGAPIMLIVMVLLLRRSTFFFASPMAFPASSF